MKFGNYLLIIVTFLGVSLTGCGSKATESAPTTAATAAPTSTIAELSSAESTSAPAATVQPTSAATSAAPTSAPAQAEVKVQALSNLNLRAGPGTNYAIVGQLPANAEMVVVGRNKDGSWLQVQTETGTVAWLTGDAALVKVDQALVAKLPTVEAPPPAYDAGNPLVNRVLNEIPLVVDHGGRFTCASHGGLNYLLPDVREGNVIGPYAGDFVYNGNNVLFKLSGGALVLIRENPVARFEGGAESLSFDKAMQLFEAGEITWTGDFGQTGRGIPGCDPKTP